MKARLAARPARDQARVRLAAAIAALPEQDRLALSLRLLEGLSTLEIAGALRVPAAEVERRLAAALKALAGEVPGPAASRRVA